MQVVRLVSILDGLKLAVMFLLTSLVSELEIHMEVLLVVPLDIATVHESVFLMLFGGVRLVHLLVLELFFLLVIVFDCIFSIIQTECVHWLLLAILIVFFDGGQLVLGFAATLGFGLLGGSGIFLSRSARFFLSTNSSILLNARFPL